MAPDDRSLQRNTGVLCRAANVREPGAYVLDTKQLILAEHDENEVRVNYSPSERVAILAHLEPIEAAKAKDREREGGRRGGKGSGKFPYPSTGEAKERAAKKVGWSGPTAEKAEAVVAAAKDQPGQFGDLQKQMDETGKVDPAFKELALTAADRKYLCADGVVR